MEQENTAGCTSSQNTVESGPQSVSPQAEQAETRRRGAPPGNQNARKCGFYAKTLSPEDQSRLLNAAEVEGLDQEVALLRARISAAAENPSQSAFLLSDISLL